MFLKYALMNPTGNKTILVTSAVTKKEYKEVTQILLKKEPTAEQVGFLAFAKDGSLDDEATDRMISERLVKENGCFMIPGFYGAMADGSIRTFTRGGSDITGALAAAALDADVYLKKKYGVDLDDPRIASAIIGCEPL